MRRVLIVGGGSDLPGRLRALAQDVQTAVLCSMSELGRLQDVQANAVLIGLPDDASDRVWIDAATALAARWPVDVLACLAEADQERAALVAEVLALPFHERQTVTWVKDKCAMRARLAEAGVENSCFRQVTSVAQLRAFYQQVGPPLIVKPHRGRASIGISMVRTEADIPAAFARTSGARAPRLGPCQPLAERYFEGPEFSIEAITQDGQHYPFAVTEKFKDARTMVETGHLVPARITAEQEAALVAHLRACLDALRVKQGITHTEMILSPSGPRIVETHVRRAGDQIVELVRGATGLDIAELMLRQVAGEDLAALPDVQARSVSPRYQAAAAIMFLVAPAAGTFAGLAGLAEVRALPWVCAAGPLVEPGTEVGDLSSSYARVGFVRVTGPDPQTALDRARSASGRVTVLLS